MYLNSAQFIPFEPFEEKQPFWHIRDPYSPQKEEWIRQKQQKFKYSIQSQPTLNVTVDENIEYKICNQTCIKYYLIESDTYNYISESQLRRKVESCSNQESQHKLIQQQQKKMEKTCVVLPQFYKDHRYFNFPNTICRYCKNIGHQINSCYKLKRIKREQVYYGAYICYSCNKRGHIAKFCKLNQQQFGFGYETSEGFDGSPKLSNPFLLIQSKYEQTGIQY